MIRVLAIICSSGFVISSILLAYVSFSSDTYEIIVTVTLALMVVFFFFCSLLAGSLYVQGHHRDIYE
jgi:hypothetical protein